MVKLRKICDILLWLLVIMTILLVNLYPANAIVEADYDFELNQNANIKVACFDTNNKLCTNATSCYITINYPDGNNLIEGAEMTFGENYYSYVVNSSVLNQKGEYRNTINCEGAYSGYTSFVFSVSGNSLFGFDLRRQSNVILLFVMILLYLGLMIIGFAFNNFGFAGFGFFVGIIIGFMLSGLHIFLTLLFIFINIAIFYGFSRKNK
jgi:hypothetical protein